jgi:hypothetical protein
MRCLDPESVLRCCDHGSDLEALPVAASDHSGVLGRVGSERDHGQCYSGSLVRRSGAQPRKHPHLIVLVPDRSWLQGFSGPMSLVSRACVETQ